MNNDVTRLLLALHHGTSGASDELLALIYSELRQLAAAKMAREQPGQTLQPTALVHEAWLRLGDGAFENRAHFFSAAAEAMRRILIERARRKHREKRGSGAEHLNVDDFENEAGRTDDALARLAKIIDATPRKERWLLRRGELLEKASRTDAAREAFAAAHAALEAVPADRRATAAMQDLAKSIDAALARLR